MELVLQNLRVTEKLFKLFWIVSHTILQGLKKATCFFYIFTTWRRTLKYQLCFMSLLLCKFSLCFIKHFKKSVNKNILTQYWAKTSIYLNKKRHENSRHLSQTLMPKLRKVEEHATIANLWLLNWRNPSYYWTSVLGSLPEFLSW